MNRNDENIKLIDEITEEMNKLDLDTLEEKVIKLIQAEKEFASLGIEERDIYKYKEKILVYLNRIIAINQNIADDSERLRCRIQGIYNELSLPCELSFMDMPFNNSVFAVRLFYSKLQEQYINTPSKYMLLGLIPNSGGRHLDRSVLTDDEKIIYDETNKYLQLVCVNRLFNGLIDLCKCIIYNFLEHDKSESED